MGEGLAMIERALAALTPESVEGYRHIRAVIERDGALSAAEKALLVAAGASVRSNAQLAREEIARGRERGLTDELIASAAATLLLSRGEHAAGNLLAAAGPLDVDAPARPRSELDARSYFLDYNRSTELPPRMAILAERSPDAFEAYFRMHHAALSADPSAARFAELLLCSLCAADLQPSFVAIHTGTARRAGATDEQLVEAAVCAMALAGAGAWASAAPAIFPEH